MIQADRGCAAVAFFGGVGTGPLKDMVVTLRGATDFREERNPPQADSIVSSINRESKLCTKQYCNISIIQNIAILYHIMRTVLRSTTLW